jgi:hypothetical protein
MSQITDLQAEIAALQARLTVLNRVPADTFFFGTVLRFQHGATMWHYIKVEQETWADMKTGVEKDLPSWVLDALDALSGAYFEVYEVRPQPTPFFTSA